MELLVNIKKVTTKEKEGLVTISTTFETVVKAGDTEIVGELSALHGSAQVLTIKPVKG